MRWALALALGAACAHAPAVDLHDVVPGELVVVTERAASPEALVAQLSSDTWRVEYLAAASATTHLVRVTRADGAALDAAQTEEARKALATRGARAVELNRRRQPR